MLAGGHDHIYPPEHAGLLDSDRCQPGAALSEMPLGWEPRARDFPRRNRLISGLALGVVVVEAARRSGSLITARMALEQGREVFAVPGSPLDPRAEGTNDLLKEGATLVTEAADVIGACADPGRPLVCRSEEPDADRRRRRAGRRDERARIVGLLGPTPVASTIWCGCPARRPRSCARSCSSSSSPAAGRHGGGWLLCSDLRHLGGELCGMASAPS